MRGGAACGRVAPSAERNVGGAPATERTEALARGAGATQAGGAAAAVVRPGTGIVPPDARGRAAGTAIGTMLWGVAACAAAQRAAALRPPQRAQSVSRWPLTKLETNLAGGCGRHYSAAGHCGRPVLKSAATLGAEIVRPAAAPSAARCSLRKLVETRAGDAAAVSILAAPQSAVEGAPDARKAPRTDAWRPVRRAPCAGRRLPSF